MALSNLRTCSQQSNACPCINIRPQLADDPEDPGFTCGHDTVLFEKPRIEFEGEIALEASAGRIVEI